VDNLDVSSERNCDARIDLNDNSQIDYWTKEFDLTVDELRELVATHGVMLVDVKRAIGR
jgi:hypothetical protein